MDRYELTVGQAVVRAGDGDAGRIEAGSRIGHGSLPGPVHDFEESHGDPNRIDIAANRDAVEHLVEQLIFQHGIVERRCGYVAPLLATGTVGVTSNNRRVGPLGSERNSVSSIP